MEPKRDAYKTVTVTHIFDASRESVWKMWTDPLLFGLWWGPKNFTAPSVTMDVSVGGAFLWCMHGRQGPGQEPKDFWNVGTYQEVVPMDRLAYVCSFSDAAGNVISPAEYGMPGMAAECRVTVTFADAEGNTKIVLTHEGLPDGALAEACQMGWLQSFEKIDALLK